MNEDRIQGAIDNSESMVKDYNDLIARRIGSFEDDIIFSRDMLQREAEVVIIDSESLFVRVVAVIIYDAQYHTLRAYFYSSPSLSSIVAAIWKALKAVWEVVKIILAVLNIIQTLNIDQMLFRMFPEFEKFVRKTMNQISKFSKALGWGVDGVLHLINAVHGGINIFSAVSGREFTSLKLEWLEKSETVMKFFSGNLSKMQENPGEWLNWLVEVGEMQTWSKLHLWWEDKSQKITAGIDKAGQALTGMGTITSELAAIQADMPQTVAKYIPQGVWDSLAKADNTINDVILPKLSVFSDKLIQLDKVLAYYQSRTQELAKRMAFPGDMLLELDKLQEFLRINQEQKIDDVASRQFERDNAEGFAGMTGDLERFERVDAALRAPTPEPEFLSIEAAPGRVRPGIVAEERETWFVGDY